MDSTLLDSDEDGEQGGRQLGGQMSFLEHLDELRRRLIRAIIFIFIALVFCWFVSSYIYNFLAAPRPASGVDGRRADSLAQHHQGGRRRALRLRANDKARDERRPAGRLG